MNRRHLLLTAAALGLAAAAGPSGATAADFPTRPIRLLVPYAAGGGTDALARVIAQAVSEKLGQQVVVENNGSAGGNVATAQAASAAPDGYTVLMANQGPMVVNPHLFKNVKVDPLTAFEPITLIAGAPLVVVVPPGSPFTSLKELVDDGKANPGKLTYGSAGNGSASHLATLLLAQTAGLEMVHTPYKGAGPALNDVMGGQTDFMITTVPSVVGLVDGQKVRPLAVTTKDRTKRMAEVPTFAESGFAGYDTAAWYGFVVPKGTPEPAKAAIREATLAALKDPTVLSRLANEGAEPVGNTPAEFAAYMQAESKRWAELVKTAGLSLD